MTKAIRIHANGGPNVMCFEDIALPPPGPGEIRIRHTAIGVNFSDVNVRRGGFYLTAPPSFPIILGNEAAGVVATVGAGVADIEVGERVAYAGVGGPFYESTGAYAEERNVPAACLIKLPREVSDRQAAALLVKGVTASTIVNQIFRPRPRQTILIHAAASGVALVLCQWCKHAGATVIGTVGSPEKARVAAAHGCDHAILYRDTDFVPKVKELAPASMRFSTASARTRSCGRSIVCGRSACSSTTATLRAMCRRWTFSCLPRKARCRLRGPDFITCSALAARFNPRPTNCSSSSLGASSTRKSVAPTRCVLRRWRIATLKVAALSARCCCCRNRTLSRRLLRPAKGPGHPIAIPMPGNLLPRHVGDASSGAHRA
jgi:D-arabinose 1-dehydrogenase-like Zn-dependent alcohol dehydrogenase